MAVFHPHTVSCTCGNQLRVELADSINVRRSPAQRDRILAGALHRTICPACKREMTVEKPFYYTDFDRNAVFQVLPRSERHRWKKASAELDKAAGFIPEGIQGEKAPKQQTLRVVFGMDELREKLVAQDAGFDDRHVELFKVFLVYEHPILLRRPRLRLTLTEVRDDALQFLALYEHDPRRFRLQLPRNLADDLAAQPDKLQQWVNDSHDTDLFALPDHWVNVWRWSPQPTALERLRAYAEAVQAGKPVDTGAPEFKQMLKGLPRGTHLPDWAKRDLRTLQSYARKQGLQQLQDELFEIRFGVTLEDDWSNNSNTNDIDTLWDLLKDLPDSNVEGNTKIHELLLGEWEGGGWYDPTSGDIMIGSDELENRERFQDVVRHEIGHAVHEKNDELVNQWLTQRFGWHSFGTTDAEIDAWVGLMGGWGSLDVKQQREVRGALKTALGSGSSWNPGPTPSLPAGHPWYGGNFGPRLAFEKTGSNWFNNFKTWYRKGTQAFFLNYWYGTLMVVDDATLQLIKKMPDSYAAMSHFEFFAELYALYYDLDDPKRPAVPADAAQWLEKNIGATAIGAPMPAKPRVKRKWETTKRPRAKKK